MNVTSPTGSHRVEYEWSREEGRQPAPFKVILCSKILPNKVNMLRNEDSHKTNVHTPRAVLQSPTQVTACTSAP